MDLLVADKKSNGTKANEHALMILTVVHRSVTLESWQHRQYQTEKEKHAHTKPTLHIEPKKTKKIE